MSEWLTRRSFVVMGSVFTVALGATACGESAGGEDIENETVDLMFATSYAPDHPMNSCGAEYVAEQAEAKLSGISVTVSPANQLGSEFDRQEQLIAGSLEMNVVGPFNAMRWHEPVGVLESAYVFDDIDHMLEVTHGEIGDELFEPLIDDGFRILDTWYFGTRQTTANNPIREPGDLSGLKIRFPDAENYLNNAKAMGADSAVPYPFAEVYTGLQQGVIDAQENPVSTIKSDGFWEVQDYISLTGHGVGAMMPSINESVWQSLAAEQQDGLKKIITEAGEKVRECVETDEVKTLDEWSQGGAITVVDDVDVEAFKERVREELPQYQSDETNSYYDRIRQVVD